MMNHHSVVFDAHLGPEGDFGPLETLDLIR